MIGLWSQIVQMMLNVEPITQTVQYVIRNLTPNTNQIILNTKNDNNMPFDNHII